jgi:hypothetical protein
MLFILHGMLLPFLNKYLKEEEEEEEEEGRHG